MNKRDLKTFLKSMLKATAEYIEIIYNFINENFNILLFMLYIFFALYFSDKSNIKIMLIITCIIAIAMMLKKINDKSLENEIKKDYKRFTIKKANGDITIEEGRLNQAIIFMSILEDEYEKK